MPNFAQHGGIKVRFASGQRNVPISQCRVAVHVEWWYMPLLIGKVLRREHVPMWHWPAFYWRYYTKRSR
jgi:hypothetical protein